MKITINLDENIYTRLFDNGTETSEADRIEIETAIRKGKIVEKKQIIHCKDCEHFFFASNRIPTQRCYVCDFWGKDHQEPNGFCNHAIERSR